MWSIYSALGWTWTKHHLIVLSKFFTSSSSWTSLPCSEELTDVTSPRPENFLVHGLFSPFFYYFFLLVDLNKSNMEIRDSHNIMYIT